MFAPNKTARMNGSGLTPSCDAILIAIGVPIAAAALFETTFVISVMSSMKALRTMAVGSPAAAPTKLKARKSAMPVPTSALPNANAVTMIMTTGIDRAAPASRQPRQPVTIISPRPTIALTEIGSIPSAAASTTNPMIASALLALCVCGRSVVPSRTNIEPLSFKLLIASLEPCTSKTSPARRRTMVRSPVTCELGALARCSARGTSP